MHFPRIFMSFPLALTALADVTPTSPSPGQVFQQGSSCTIGWNPDQTGTWKELVIQLMTGDNFNMVPLTTVATVDGTTSPGTFSYTCPAVNPPAPIYFYQFSSPASSNKSWTGRFTISDASGKTVPAPIQNQPDGEAIPWGTGVLVGNTTTNGTSATPLSSAVVVSSSAVPSSNAPASTPVVAVSDLPTSTVSGVAADASATAGSTTTSSGSNSGGASALRAVSARAAQAGVGLAVIAATFMFLV